MNEQQNILDAGDYLSKINNSGVIGRVRIDRVTEKRAYGKGLTFDRSIKDSGKVKQIGGDVWNPYSYKLETEELKSQLEERMIRKKLLDFDKWRDISIDDAMAISKIIEKYK